jgi:hypothetical protein
MTFIIEEIPEQEKEKIILLASTFPNGYNPSLSPWWAVDREKGVYILITNKVGGAYEGTPVTKCYTLNWEGKLIHLTADPLEEIFLEKGAIMNWRIHELQIPTELQDQKEAVLQLIRDAFTAIGLCFDGDRYIAVNVEFDLPYHLD